MTPGGDNGVAAARERLSTKFGMKRELERIGEHLHPGEVVSHLAGGSYGGGQGLLALTDRRLFFFRDGRMHKASEDFPLSQVSSVQWKSGLSTGTVSIHASNAVVKIGTVNKVDGEAIVGAAREAVHAANVAPGQTLVAPVVDAPADVAAQLANLAQLHDSGALSDDEFAAAKARVLGGAS